MKLHCHIPTLLVFAMDAAADDINLRGKKGLLRPMPKVLYLKCIAYFADKYSTSHSIKRMYDVTRLGNELEPHDMLQIIDKSCVSAMCLLDHIARNDDVQLLTSVVRQIMQYSDHDVPSVIDCMHRFAARCDSSLRHDILTSVMSAALKYCTFRCIRDVVIQYGGYLDANDDDYVETACTRGLCTIVSDAVSRGFRLKRDHLMKAIASGDSDTVSFVSNSMSEPVEIGDGGALCVRDVDVSLCQLLMNSGIITHGNRYRLYFANSIDVIQWFIRNDMVDVDDLVRGVIDNATARGGAYIDAMHYIIDDMHVPVPRDILKNIHVIPLPGIVIMDYLVVHGADVNVCDDKGILIAYKLPLMLRYWLDRDINNVDVVCRNVVESCILTKYDVHAIDICVRMRSFDINLASPQGMTLLHVACHRQHSDAVSLMLKYGADVNAADITGQRPLHIACTKKNLVIATMLLDNKALLYARDRDGRLPYDVTHHKDVRQLLCSYGYRPRY